MERGLEELKSLVRDRYLGRAGIHGVGVRRSGNALLVFVHAETPDQPAVLQQIREQAAPYPVVTVTGAQPLALQ